MRMAGRFSRRIRAYAKAHDIPVVDCSVGERKHDLAQEYLAKTKITRGLFLVLVGRARGPGVAGRPKPSPRAQNPYALRQPLLPSYPRSGVGAPHHQDQRTSPFPAQVMLNGHEYVACQAGKAGISFTKEGNCFTHISDAAGLAKIADTLSEPQTIGRLSQVCERWI